MKVGVSLPDEDVEFLDQYAQTRGTTPAQPSSTRQCGSFALPSSDTTTPTRGTQRWVTDWISPDAAR